MLIFLAIAILPLCIMVWAGLQFLGVLKPLGEKGGSWIVHGGILLAGLLTIPLTVFSVLYAKDLTARFGGLPVNLPHNYYEPGAPDIYFIESLGEAHAIFLVGTVQFLLCMLGYFILLKPAARNRAVLFTTLSLFGLALASFALQMRFPYNW